MKPTADCIYYLPRPVWYVAINYNASTRTLDDPLCEPAKDTRLPQK